LASACGSHAPAEDSSSSGRVTVRYMGWDTQEELASRRKQLETVFEPANPGIHVENLIVPASDYQVKLATMFAAGLAPDVVNIHEAFLPTAAENGLILPLDSLVANDPEVNLNDYNKKILDECHYRDGHLYKLPTTGSVVVMYYNKDAFDKAGVKYPDDTWTWADLLAAAKALTIRDSDGRIVQWGLEGTGWLHWLDFVWQNGGEVFDKEDHLVIGKPEYIDQNVEALQFLQDLILVHKVTRYFSSADVQPVNPFIGGQNAISLSGSWQTTTLVRNWQTLKARGEEGKMIRWGIAPLPKQRRRAALFFSGAPVIARDTPHPREAWQVLKFFSSESWQMNLAEHGEIPALNSVAWSDAYLHQEGVPEDVDLRVVLQAFDYARPQPAGPVVSELMEKQISTMIDNISMGRIAGEGIRAALLELQTAVDSACPYCSEKR
jgi:multiple sugar transport system substrate-binding protein